MWHYALVLLVALCSFGRAQAAESTDAQTKCYSEEAVSRELQIAACTEVIRTGVDLPRAYYARGIAQHQSGYYDLAIADFTRVIELTPDSADAYRNRCWSESAASKNDGALADCNHAIELDTNCGDCWILRAQVHGARSEFAEALNDTAVAIQQRPNRSFYYFYRGRMLEKLGRLDDAVAVYNAALRLDPGDQEASQALDRLAAAGKNP